MMTLRYWRMFRVLTLGTVWTVLANAASAQKPTAEQLIARHEAAVGGKPALDAHSSVKMTGVVILSLAELRGTIEVVRAKPNQFVEKMTIGPLGEMLKGYDGKIAWVLESSEPALLTDADAESMKRIADWHHEFSVTQAMRGARVDSTDFEEQPAWRVTYASLLGEEVRTYFSMESGLRIGEESLLGVGTATTIYSDYKSFGAVKLPMRILTKRGSGGEMLINYLTVEFDKVPASAFALPPAVKAIAR
jgi:hypothetical protein